MQVRTIKRSILTSDQTFICHQCNCVTNKSYGLAADIFNEYPYANVYKKREEPSRPGTIRLCGDGEKNRFVINMFSQYYPGKPKYPTSREDGYYARLCYFKRCLKTMNLLKGSFAFPYEIGCGLAGGNWEKYLDALYKFSKTNEVYLYKPDISEGTLFKGL